MNPTPKISEQNGLDDYMRLFSLYDAELHDFSGNGRGVRFELLFQQAVTLLLTPLSINQVIPSPFLGVAQKYSEGKSETLHHFDFEENRHFFLCDLYDWLKIHDRGRMIRQMGSN